MAQEPHVSRAVSYNMMRKECRAAVLSFVSVSLLIVRSYAKNCLRRDRPTFPVHQSLMLTETMGCLCGECNDRNNKSRRIPESQDGEPPTLHDTTCEMNQNPCHIVAMSIEVHAEKTRRRQQTTFQNESKIK